MAHKLARMFRHLWLDEADTRRAIPRDMVERLTRRVAASEKRHTGEIRIYVEAGLPLSYLWRDATVRERAVAMFGKLRVWDTEQNNGVLIYLLMADHAIEIVADRALHRAVPAASWQAVLEGMQQDFRRDAYAQGMETALLRVSDLLAAHFPADAAHHTGHDASLPDTPVVQGRFFKDL